MKKARPLSLSDRTRAAIAFAMIATGTSGCVSNPPQARAPDLLLPRELFFGNPTVSRPSMSPDGRWLSWIAPSEGVMNIWVAPTSNPTQARPLTRDRDRPLRTYWWLEDSRTIVFRRDSGGDEAFRLYSLDTTTGAEKQLSPPGARARLLESNERGIALLGINERNPRYQDVYRADTATGKLELLFTNDRFSRIVADRFLRPRVGVQRADDGAEEYFRIIDGKVEELPFARVPYEDTELTIPLSFSADGDTLYWLDTRGKNTAALVAHDLEADRQTVLAEHPEADVAGVFMSPRLGTADVYSVSYLKRKLFSLDPDLRPDLEHLHGLFDGEIELLARSSGDDKWLLEVDQLSSSPAVYLYDREARRPQRLFVTNAELEGKPLAHMHALEIPARDGLTLVSYLTLPRWIDPDGDGRPSRPLPLVLLVHGGPADRDRLGYNARHQWLANRGYAVLSVNFRGSNGFGRSFLSAGNLQWGGAMQRDLEDAVEWAERNRIAEPGNVAIMGASYGGYATLAGLAFTPQRYRCGVAQAAISNLETLLEAQRGLTSAGIVGLYMSIGDSRTEQGRALLQERSPLLSAERIARPLLIAHGVNDTRVPQAEADQLVARLKMQNVPVTYALFPDEGHAFRRPENLVAMNAITEHFLAKCLGGRAEPFSDDLRSSNVVIEQTGDYIPDLDDALSKRE